MPTRRAGLSRSVFELSMFDCKPLSPPHNGVSGESCYPQPHGYHVPEGNQPQAGKDLAIAQYFGTYGHGQGQAQKEAQSQKPQTQWAESASDQVQERPAQPVSEDQARVAPGTGVAHRPVPAQLVIEEALPCVGGDAGFDHFGAQRHRVPGLENALPELVVDGQMVHQRGQAADVFESFAAHGQGGPQPVTQAALDPAG